VIASLPTNKECHYIADIIEFGNKIGKILENTNVYEFVNDDKIYYSVSHLWMIVVEACIKIDGRKHSGRFEQLFPDYNLKKLRAEANKIRHDYHDVEEDELWQRTQEILPDLIDQAENWLRIVRKSYSNNRIDEYYPFWEDFKL